MPWCLPPEFVDKFIAGLRDGTVDPHKLADLSSEDRRAELAKYVGEENAQDVNARLENAILKKDQERAYVTWAKQVGGLTEPAKRDFVSRIERMDKLLNPADEKSFLADAAAQKLGATPTFEEAKNISDQAKTAQTLKAGIPETAPIRSPERLAYGLALDNFHDYMNHLMGKDKTFDLKDFVTHPSQWLETAGGFTKGILASMDVSFFLRQGLKMLFTNPDQWANAFLKTWGDIGRELKGVDAMKPIRADILSRPNSLNGKYRAMGADLAVDFEEALPSHLPEKIPVFGRLYKASEAAFNGAALRMRADLADRMIDKAEGAGLDMTNPDQAKGIGELVNSLTGRGKIDLLSPRGQRFVNATMFSVKFLKSNYDLLTMHRLGFAVDNPATQAFVRREAALNLLKVAGGIGAVLFVADKMWPGSVDPNPLSSQSGKIKLGQTTFDVSAGMGALVTLAARLGSMSTKSSTTGNVTTLSTGKFGAKTAMDIFNSFWEGRLSPLAGAVRDYLNGQNYQGQKPTLANTAANLVTPLPFQTIMQSANEPNGAVRIAAIIADALGISTNPPNPLGVGLSPSNPVEQELVRLNFSSYNVDTHTGNAAFDDLVTKEMGPMLDKTLTGVVQSPGYAKLPDSQKHLMIDTMLKSIRKMAVLSAASKDPEDFMKLRQSNSGNARLQAMLGASQ